MTEHEIGKIFAHIPTLDTPRLILRRITPDYSDDMYDYSRMPEVTEYLLWDPHSDPDYTYRYLCQVQRQYREGKFYDWGLIDRQSGRLIGTCGFTSFDPNHDRAEVGYVLHPDYWGHGLAPEALSAVLRYGFVKLGLNRVEAHYMAENTRSRAVMEKCGMKFEGVLRQYLLVKGKYRDIGFCSILRSEYEGKYGKIECGDHWYDRLRQNLGI